MTQTSTWGHDITTVVKLSSYTTESCLPKKRFVTRYRFTPKLHSIMIISMGNSKCSVEEQLQRKIGFPKTKKNKDYKQADEQIKADPNTKSNNALFSTRRPHGSDRSVCRGCRSRLDMTSPKLMSSSDHRPFP